MLVVPVVGIVGEDEVALAVCLAVGYVFDPNIADIREILGFQRIPLIHLLPVTATVLQPHVDMLRDFEIAVPLHRHVVVKRAVA